jgi:putative peptidoglycan lipid II flippase
MSARGSIGSMMAATLVSRALGFLKAILLVAAIGGTSEAIGGQTFEIANSAPTYLFALIAGGVLGAVLVPQIVRNLHDGPAGQENTDRLLTIVLVGGAVATVVLTLCAPGIVWIYATPWSAQWRGLATSMAYWCLPQIFFLIAFAVLSQVLNARGVFGAPAWAPAVSNLLGISGILVFLFLLPTGLGTVDSWSPLMIAVLSGSATLAIAIQALLLLIPLRRIGFRIRLRWGFGGLGHMSTLAGWTLLGVIAGQAAYLVTSNVASNAGKTLNELGVDGPSLNSLSMAYLLMLLPHGIVTVSLTTALYTRMSGSAARNNLAEIDALSTLASKPVAYIAIAASAAFVALVSYVVNSLVKCYDGACHELDAQRLS